MGTVASVEVEAYLQEKQDKTLPEMLDGLVQLGHRTIWGRLLGDLLQDYQETNDPEPIIQFFNEDFPYPSLRELALSYIPVEKPLTPKRPSLPQYLE